MNTPTKSKETDFVTKVSAKCKTDFSLVVFSLWYREITRFLRQPSRIAGALGAPFVFWIFIGAGFGSSFQGSANLGIVPGQVGAANASYLHYFFPGTVLLILLFSSIFSTISLIQDRSEGFLQSILVSPASRASFILGKVLGGTTVTFIQGFLLILVSPLGGITYSLLSFVGTTSIVFFLAFTLNSLGFVLAWRFNSVQGFHAVMNLFLMPLWFLSGALFPPNGAPGWIQFLMNINPLTYGLEVLRFSLYGQTNPLIFSLFPGFAFFATVVFTAFLFKHALQIASRRRIEDVV